MPLSLLNHSALALFAQRTRIPTSARSIGFCAIWVCISSSSSSITGEVGSSWSRRTAQRLLLLLAMLGLHLLSLEVALAVVGAFHWERGLEYVAAMNNWAECACAALSGAWTQFESRSFE